MDRCSSRRHITEIMLKTTFKTIQPIKPYQGHLSTFTSISVLPVLWKLLIDFFLKKPRNFTSSLEKQASGGCGLFTLCGHEKILKNSSSLKPQVRF